MKTTVEIDDELLKAAKMAALAEGLTLRDLFEDGLRQRLALHRANTRVQTWGGSENSREDLYASDAWKVLDDLEAAFLEHRRKQATS